jgi:Ca2+-binding EF-hand superfamily protein
LKNKLECDKLSKAFDLTEMGSKSSKKAQIKPKEMDVEVSREASIRIQPNIDDYELISAELCVPKSEVKSLFDKFIAQNSSGELNKKQFQSLYSSLRYESAEKLDRISKYVFQAFDADKNGTISFNEFLIGYTLTSKGDLKKRLDFAFKLYDLDDNGYLDGQEVTDVISGMLDLLGADKSDLKTIVEDCICELDKNGDNRVSKGE